MDRKLLGFLLAICVALAGVAGYSGYKVFVIEKGYNVSRKSYSKISEDFKTKIDDKEKTEITVIHEQEEEIYSPIHIDFEKLQASVNPEIYAWLWCPETIIDYPVVQHDNNDFYLVRGADLSESSNGAIFIDASNFSNFSDRNTVLHGHHMADGSMLASLTRWYNEDYLNEHPVMYLNTANNGNYMIQIFAAMEIPAGSEAYEYEFAGSEDIDRWLNWVSEHSIIHPDVKVSSSDRFVTLSTCAYSFEYARTAVVGKLIPLKA